ncbi:hypothetical protein ACLESO_08240 [Pyxidicoccus sp. 3LG]
MKTQAFAYIVSGGRSTREQFLSSAYKAGVPVVLYTSPVRVPGGKGSTGGAALTSGATASATGTSSGGDETFDPCADPNEVGDKPPEVPKDPGDANPKPVESFTRLAWTTANAVEGVSDPVSPSKTEPSPRPGTNVPR